MAGPPADRSQVDQSAASGTGADRSAIAKAYNLATRVMGIALGMSLPGFLGWWVDGHLGTTPWLMVCGFVFGFWYGLWRLIHLSPTAEPTKKQDKQTEPTDKTGPTDKTV